MPLIDVMGCKTFRGHHQHETRVTKIYSEAGLTYGPRYDTCPMDILAAKDYLPLYLAHKFGPDYKPKGRKPIRHGIKLVAPKR